MFDDLLAHPGVTEEMKIGSRIGVMAFHGGSLERMTDVIAEAVAAASGASSYIVRQPDDLRWHIPSRLVDPTRSERLAAFIDHVDVAVALHGFGRSGLFSTVLAGGANRHLAAHVADHLRVALPEYHVVDELEEIPEELRGQHPDNPVNRPRSGGVQIELPPRVRGLGPWWDDRPYEGLSPHTSDLVTGLVSALADW